MQTKSSFSVQKVYFSYTANFTKSFFSVYMVLYNNNKPEKEKKNAARTKQTKFIMNFSCNI